MNFNEIDEVLNNNYFGLEEIQELNINAKDKNNNLIIEGDNYYGLKSLIISGIKVDIIYIDPPYNTGNKDFVYNDDYSTNIPKEVSADDPHKHSKWLSFMKKRLELAKELLADDGVIFISIDDNEQAYLKVLMDEIFGEENFIANLVRETKTGGGRFGKQYIQKDFDFILCFAKKLYATKEFKKAKIHWDDYKYEDKRGKYTIKHPLDGGGGNEKYNFEVILDGIPYFPRKNRNWSFSASRINFMKENDFLVPKPNNNMIYVKNYKNWEIENYGNEYRIIKKEEGVSWSSTKFIDKKYNNASGNNELNKIMNNKEFSYPKPSTLIKDIVSMVDKNNPIILDFFAGSGTTAQAVMELNKEDDGNRRFILITNNENNIARNICRERIYRVINGCGSNGEKIEWKYSDDKKCLSNNSVKYLSIKKINKFDGEYEEINDMKKIYNDEFGIDLSIKDFIKQYE